MMTTNDLSVIKDWQQSVYHTDLHLSAHNPAAADRFLDRLIRHLHPAPASRILEVACGNGSFSTKLAEMGFVVTGVDAVAENIALTTQTDSDRLQFYVHDVRLPFWGNYFDMALNLLDRFGFYRTRREHEAAIRTIASALKPGGIVVFDYFNSPDAKAPAPQAITQQIRDNNYSIESREDAAHIYKKVTVTGPALPTPISFTAQQVKFSLEDFKEMFRHHGVQVEEVFGNYELGPYDQQSSSRLIVVGRKNDNEATDKEKRLYSDGRKTDALT
jgi:SAM-dependent methyltransferase